MCDIISRSLMIYSVLIACSKAIKILFLARLLSNNQKTINQRMKSQTFKNFFWFLFEETHPFATKSNDKLKFYCVPGGSSDKISRRMKEKQKFSRNFFSHHSFSLIVVVVIVVFKNFTPTKLHIRDCMQKQYCELEVKKFFLELWCDVEGIRLHMTFNVEYILNIIKMKNNL